MRVEVEVETKMEIQMGIEMEIEFDSMAERLYIEAESSDSY